MQNILLCTCYITLLKASSPLCSLGSILQQTLSTVPIFWLIRDLWNLFHILFYERPGCKQYFFIFVSWWWFLKWLKDCLINYFLYGRMVKNKLRRCYFNKAQQPSEYSLLYNRKPILVDIYILYPNIPNPTKEHCFLICK